MFSGFSKPCIPSFCYDSILISLSVCLSISIFLTGIQLIHLVRLFAFPIVGRRLSTHGPSLPSSSPSLLAVHRRTFLMHPVAYFYSLSEQHTLHTFSVCRPFPSMSHSFTSYAASSPSPHSLGQLLPFLPGVSSGFSLLGNSPLLPIGLGTRQLWIK